MRLKHVIYFALIVKNMKNMHLKIKMIVKAYKLTTGPPKKYMNMPVLATKMVGNPFSEREVFVG